MSVLIRANTSMLLTHRCLSVKFRPAFYDPAAGNLFKSEDDEENETEKPTQNYPY